MDMKIFFICILILFTGGKALVFTLRACPKNYDIYIELKSELMAATWESPRINPSKIQ